MLTAINNPITVGGTPYTFRTGHIDTNPVGYVANPGFATNPTAGNPVYIETRFYVPGDGSGNIVNWPSAFTYGQNCPTTGEIDIAQAQKISAVTGMTAAYNYHSVASPFSSGTLASNYVGWHVFGVLWTTTTVTYYYDGVQVAQDTTGIASAPNFINLQNAMGPNGGTNTVPASMVVEYIHAYLKGGTPITPQANYGGAGATFTGGYTYQWKRDGTTVVGTGPTYTPVAADGGGTHTLTVTVTAANAHGTSAGTTSAATRTIP